ncbi:glycosyltransferase family 2 protein [Rhodoferax sp. AJA081-3]|uniref:glycosyltransferase family 2 protein n=1 Tax=Rhodoferax sp. AJA081-3 TaxID=2752316 RepID=UPI001ADFE346|nr:hypothetical protein [Rhodoferax sp. AJA081-3]
MHRFHFAPWTSVGNHGYMGRGFLAQELSAVAMDCVVLRKEVFITHGGFDADLGISPAGAAAWCLRLREMGLRMIGALTPRGAHPMTTVIRRPHRRPCKRQIFMSRYGHQYANWLLQDPAYHPCSTLLRRIFRFLIDAVC